MTEQHPITPPRELVRQWLTEGHHQDYCSQTEHAITQAARWGSDQELEACVEWLGEAPVVYNDNGDLHPGSYLRDARRPAPPSLKEQALQAAQRFYAKGHENCTDEDVKDDFDTIRRALEQLDD